jgi:uncharacterized protein YjbJ (UPF0337 family)
VEVRVSSKDEIVGKKKQMEGKMKEIEGTTQEELGKLKKKLRYLRFFFLNPSPQMGQTISLTKC